MGQNQVYQQQIISLSSYFRVDPDRFEQYGILDIPLNADAPLFIDPQLLRKSKHAIFNTEAWDLYQKFYSSLYNDILTVTRISDVRSQQRALEAIKRRLKSKEPVGLCLGYSKGNNRGRGVGKEISGNILGSALNIIQQGINNPGIFSVLFLLEDGIGGDFVSDLTANIIMPQLLKFTETATRQLGLTAESYCVAGDIYWLPKHPFDDTYLILVPCDIINRLPTENDLSSVFSTLFHGLRDRSNDAIRDSVSKDIGEIWAEAQKDGAGSRETKRRLKNYIYKNANAVNSVVEAINNTKATPIDIRNDPSGINIPSRLPMFMVGKFPDVSKCVDKLSMIHALIEAFRCFITNNTKFKRELLYDSNGNPKHEAAWQSALQSYIDFSLKQINVDITPEFETGRGPVDFKFSEGEEFKILVELKLSTNTQYKAGLEKQLEIYKKATINVRKAYFIFIDLETDARKSQEKQKNLIDIKNRNKLDSEIIIIDGLLHESASKIR